VKRKDLLGDAAAAAGRCGGLVTFDQVVNGR